MVTKNPIENYLDGRREIDSSVYQSPEGKQPYKMNRRGFMKLAGGVAFGTFFGEGLLKQMEAWAEENGMDVYIEDFTESFQRDPPSMYNVGVSFSKELKINLSNKGVQVLDTPDGGITVFGHCTEISDPTQGHMIRVNIGYKINGQPVLGFGGSDYFNSSQYNDKIWEITNLIYNDLMRLNSRGPSGRQSKIEKEDDLDDLEEINLGPNSKRYLENPKTRQMLEDMWRKEGKILKGYRLFKMKN